ncbi:MAG: protein phosphatase CheZ [Pseudomonadota bacterium]
MSNPEKSYERGQVVEIIHSVIEKMDKGQSDQQLDVLKNEISVLAETIQKLKADISETSPTELQNEKIPDATVELDAVVESTAEATNAIMTSCEEIENIAEKLDGDQGMTLTNEITKIYEACGFQDITGQRITKVVNTLKEIDHKISMLMGALDMQVGPIEHKKVESVQPSASHDPEELLNGPQMPDNAVNQDDIDKLLAEFD